MAKFCQNIEDLEIWDCGEAIPGLINFIDNQKNLRSLALHCHKTTRILQLSEVIERKADTLIKFADIITIIMNKNYKNCKGVYQLLLFQTFCTSKQNIYHVTKFVC
ncbi:hypothetical protein RhiirC2_326656 [Rhizophagus irregularis]|uniref:Uncharacterized protein n=1 Tax=Rhizophagus irregularis TaxID=588596 RepID=A0A2N1MAA9_9GLOM|nr:hypothetical protein RhiirC2_326656 [Rhizophagus irregularis]